ncbi:MFS transporter [Roseobacter sinensis]|uniref:MFS transporter n=1 Tax=Roseobacter sinensis TaxID=2931391 RepID=A0ABT3B928_9RHOB|nr:MFS transporter [Roseobacter sp. WL0113]MCV3270072.1 MFS transporter [Roseobacter sp. WL0113]
MAALVQDRNYLKLITASGATNLADGIAGVAFPWLATLLTRDPLLIGLVAFAGRLPWLLLAVPAGVLTDRADRRRLIVQADCFRLVLALGVVGLILSLPTAPAPEAVLPYILALSALAFLLGCAEVVRDNAAQTLMPALVQKDDLEKANGQLWSVETILGRFVGPPLAGLLIGFSLLTPFFMNAVAFALAALMIWFVVLPPRIAPPKRSWRDETLEGLRWLWTRPVLRRLAVSLGIINGLSMLALVVLVLVSQERLGLSASGYGLLLTAGAVGGVLGGFLCPAIVSQIGAQRSLTLALGLIPIPFLIIGLFADPLTVAVALFFQTLVAALWNVVTVSYRQRSIPDDLLGRVNSVYRFFGWGTMSLGALLGGAVVSFGEPFLGRDLALSLPFVLAAAGTGLLFLWGVNRLKID